MKTDFDIYLVDDDADFREATVELLEDAGLKVQAFSSADPMVQALDPEWTSIRRASASEHSQRRGALASIYGTHGNRFPGCRWLYPKVHRILRPMDP